MKIFKRADDTRLGKGLGPDYVPYFTIQNAHSWGTSTMVYDPFEKRHMHFLSRTETLFYFSICLDETIRYRREQFPMDMNVVNKILREMGERQTDSQYTTDLLIDYKDGTSAAFSVKWDRREFDENSRLNKMHPKRFGKLIRRQYIEKEYWESQGIPFSIITMDDIPIVRANNNQMIISHCDPKWLVNPEQKILFLYFVGALPLPDDYDTRFINPKRLAEECPVNIDSVFESIVKKGYSTW